MLGLFGALLASSPMPRVHKVTSVLQQLVALGGCAGDPDARSAEVSQWIAAALAANAAVLAEGEAEQASPPGGRRP